MNSNTDVAQQIQEEPRRRRDRFPHSQHQIRLPRTLLLWWSIWLLASWVFSFGWSSPFMPNLRAYGSSVRQLLVLVAIGLMIVWPLFRLSAQNRGAPRIVAFVDFIALVFTLQVVLWPMRMAGQWSVLRLAALDFMLCSWALVISACIAMGTALPFNSRTTAARGLSRPFRRAHFRRAAWMSVCLLISLIGPLVSLAIDPTDTIRNPLAAEVFQWSPIASAWWTSAHTLDAPEWDEWLRIGVVAAAGIIAWLGLLVQARSNDRSKHANYTIDANDRNHNPLSTSTPHASPYHR